MIKLKVSFQVIINDMNYYQVAISAKLKLINGELPIYRCSDVLPAGEIVSANYGRKKVVGVVIDKSAKPKFGTKALVPLGFKLNKNSLSLAKKIASYYGCSIHQVINLFIPASIDKKFKPPEPGSEAEFKPQVSKPLTAEQSEVLEQIINSDKQTFVLRGQTGSGKSYIYLKLAEKIVKEGKSAVILTPEISLSPQLVELFSKHLSVPVITLNSQMTAAKRREAWLRISKLKSVVVIGPRSALFSPINNLSLIVIDEFHETTYKNDTQPKYNTQVVASMLANVSGAKLILGSATPRIQDYWLAQQKDAPILEMSKKSASKIEFIFVDQNDKNQFTKSKILSNLAIETIKLNLAQNLQTIIFHNQRGTARSLLCAKCDWVYSCSSCGSRLVFHKQEIGAEHFFCHLCAKKYPLVTTCELGHTDIRLVGFGTKRIVDEVARIFPEAITYRMDTDQVELTSKLKDIENNQVQIVVGTQMLAKGHNFKNLRTVIIPQADTGLSHPDFTAQEKTYQLLHQVIGRVGRFNIDGQIIAQTYSPKNKILNLAANGSFQDFYDYEIDERRLSLMPPFCFALKISVAYKKESYAKEKLEQFIAGLDENSFRFLGPSPAFQKKVGGSFKYQVIILASNRALLSALVAKIPTNFNFDIDPINFL